MRNILLLLLFIGFTSYGQVTQKTFKATQYMSTDTIKGRTMTKINFFGNRLEWLADPINSQDAVNKRYLGNYVLKADSLTTFVTPKQLSDSISASIGGSLSDVVYISGSQTITGEKTFSPITTFSNGISVSKSGGTGVSVYNIDAIGLNVFGSRSGSYIAEVNNTSGSGILVSGSIYGLRAESLDIPIYAYNKNTINNGYATAMSFKSPNVSRLSGYGMNQLWEMSNSSSVSKIAADFGARWTTATSGSEASSFEWNLMNSGSLSKKMDLQGNGTLNVYGLASTIGLTSTSENRALYAHRTATGSAALIEADDGAAVEGYGYGAEGYGVVGYSSYIPIQGTTLQTSGTGVKMVLGLNGNSANTTVENGYGLEVRWDMPWKGNTNNLPAAWQQVYWDDVTLNAEKSKFVWKLRDSGVTSERMTLKNDGELITNSHTLVPLTTAPTTPSAGEIYSNVNGHVYYYNGSSWVQLDMQADAVYTITLPSGASVSARVAGAVAGTDYPLGWTLSAYGVNPADLQIVHNMGKRIASVTVFTVNGTSERQLFNNAAFSGIIAPDQNTLRIESLATIVTPIVIHLIFD